ncbi:class I SAM-dependent methyltransferase [Dyella monticola]|uniref:Class I SAM-dependent methyltransferase n=1 Tax=Dyella monticola TaxID=1927958 RepID=A0A370X818_9GAMM|nr:class I SAM-dependent methyltransferase [Dyella monticola]RDS84528.1 class I SAM-dependent methyltransferase [Dyella monticola]
MFSNVTDPHGNKVTHKDSVLVSSTGESYPIIRGVPRFVSSENYANAFGDQWNRFPKTQLDSYSGLTLSEDRLERCMQGQLKSLAGKRVLEAGSGSGRFTEILLKYGSIVDSFDYSSAVDANANNNGSCDRLTLVQADIRYIPFVKASYDYVVCLGVLQHTPDPEESIRSLWQMVKPGGRLVIDHYRWKFRNFLPPPLGVAAIAYRHYFLKLPKEKQFGAVKRIFDFWFPMVWAFRKSKIIQFALSRLTPIMNHYPSFGLRDRDMYYEWMLLDTHDAMTDVYKHRRSPKQIHKTLSDLGAINIVVVKGGNGVEAFCEKPKVDLASCAV